MKQFTQEKWQELLNSKDWSQINSTKSVDEKAVKFDELIQECLDKIAPFKSFIVKSHYKFGISNVTKEIINKRDHTRQNISKAGPTEKQILITKYKKLRNLVNAKIRKETIAHNNERVKNAKNENKIWKVVKEVTNPQKDNNWSLHLEDGSVSNDESKIANTFNDYFITKIKLLKDGIDPNLKEDPLEKLRKKMEMKENKPPPFSFKKTTSKKVEGFMKKMKKKTSPKTQP